jgi:hypothetical protein
MMIARTFRDTISPNICFISVRLKLIARLFNSTPYFVTEPSVMKIRGGPPTYMAGEGGKTWDKP